MDNMNLNDAIEIAKRNSTLPKRHFWGSGFNLNNLWQPGNRLSCGMHPTRNDIDRDGKPNRKKKGSPKTPEWLK